MREKESDILILKMEVRDFHKLDDTYAWNYHKGCRLQWLDKNRIIFNTAIGGKICSKSININTKTEKYMIGLLMQLIVMEL